MLCSCSSFLIISHVSLLVHQSDCKFIKGKRWRYLFSALHNASIKVYRKRDNVMLTNTVSSQSAVAGEEWVGLFSLWPLITRFVTILAPPLFLGSFSYRAVYSRRNLNVCPPMYDTVVWTIPPTHLKNVSLVQLVPLPPINCFFLVCLHQNDPINLYLHSCAEEHGLEWETLMRINAGWLTISVSSSLCL